MLRRVVWLLVTENCEGNCGLDNPKTHRVKNFPNAFLMLGRQRFSKSVSTETIKM